MSVRLPNGHKERGWAPHRVCVLEGLRPLALASVGGAAVGEEDVVGGVEGDGVGEEGDGLVVVLGGEGLVACVFECGDLWRVSVVDSDEKDIRTSAMVVESVRTASR